jgi:hypothetical protein
MFCLALQARNVTQKSNQQGRDLYPVDAGINFLRSIDKLLRDFMASYFTEY